MSGGDRWTDVTISLEDGDWSFWDYVKVTLAASAALAIIVLIALVPALLSGQPAKLPETYPCLSLNLWESMCYASVRS